jgi:hypothetical protein
MRRRARIEFPRTGKSDCRVGRHVTAIRLRDSILTGEHQEGGLIAFARRTQVLVEDLSKNANVRSDAGS